MKNALLRVSRMFPNFQNLQMSGRRQDDTVLGNAASAAAGRCLLDFFNIPKSPQNKRYLFQFSNNAI
jgi:hypothetical protein